MYILFFTVTSVRSARQAIDALNVEGSEIDIILVEVDLPMKKGMKMLKYITRDKELQRIPLIMMSAQDEVSIVVKCLRLGAVDYLMKPLRTNELLNLWTLMLTLFLSYMVIHGLDQSLVSSACSDWSQDDIWLCIPSLHVFQSGRKESQRSKRISLRFWCHAASESLFEEQFLASMRGWMVMSDLVLYIIRAVSTSTNIGGAMSSKTTVDWFYFK
ncbi:hypothetical protein Droror1_Dr00012182 [Drosera rotundifolia]